MNREKLIKKVLDEMKRIKEEEGLDILFMPDDKLEQWVEYLIERYQ